MNSFQDPLLITLNNKMIFEEKYIRMKFSCSIFIYSSNLTKMVRKETKIEQMFRNYFKENSLIFASVGCLSKQVIKIHYERQYDENCGLEQKSQKVIILYTEAEVKLKQK